MKKERGFITPRHGERYHGMSNLYLSRMYTTNVQMVYLSCVVGSNIRRHQKSFRARREI